VSATIQTFAQQNLSLRGHRESLVNDSNPENFLALFKHLAKFVPVIRERLESISGKPGCLSCFSSAIQNRLINLLGARVRQIIVSSIQKVKYYGIIFDTSPKITRTEQMLQIVKFIEIQPNYV
jgi:hypothetical protein